MDMTERRWIVLRPTDTSQLEFHEGEDGGATVLWLVSPDATPDSSGRLRICVDLDRSEMAKLGAFCRAIAG